MMWMVDSNEQVDECRKVEVKKMGTDPLLYGRKLRPLMPRPMKEMMLNIPFSTPPSSCSCCVKNPNLLQWNHPPIISKRSGADHDIIDHHRERPLVSTRWNPTPEQLQALEEMYRRGVRTPSAEQIQQIASKLRRFGKIEGKNVFYWFQNHKARERQKKRRHEDLQSPHPPKNIRHHHQSPGVSRRSYIEIEDHHQKLATPPSNCTSTPSEDSASMQAGAVITPDFRQDEWTQLHHQNNILTAKNEEQTCSLQSHFNSSCFSPNSSTPLHHPPSQTLHLFPILASCTSLDPIPNSPSTIQTKFTPNQFIEFLPTKNSTST